MLDPSQILQSFFLLSAATLLFVNSVPALKSRFIAYGPRATPAARLEQDGAPKDDVKATTASEGPISWLLDNFAALQVPHGYFLHFYIVSAASLGFWMSQLLTKGAAFRLVTNLGEPESLRNAVSVDQIALTWALMMIQTIRRLFEASFLAKPSTSKMWFVHWLLGIAFYLAISATVWIEGAGTVLYADSVWSSITFSAPSLKSLLSIPIFVLASGVQHDYHAHLATIPKYTLPQHPIFHSIICPHYLMECLIYLSLAMISAPKGALLNKTMFTALVFVSTNLAVTASTSKQWYEKKFGKDAVAGRWKMIPYLY